MPQGQLAVAHLLTDSRRIVFPPTTLFFALSGARRSGNAYIDDAYQQGVRCFVVNDAVNVSLYADANFIVSANPLEALQTLAAYHRSLFNLKVIGITGSNGKTIVKEWLYQMLHQDYNIVRSPKSFNSQIGVPLSIWQMQPEHTLGIFEAGISLPGEMEALENIIQPTIGIITNIGAAHNTGFASKQQKAAEKWKLFGKVGTIICPSGYEEFKPLLFKETRECFTWSRLAGTLQITRIIVAEKLTTVSALYLHQQHSITIPFTDNASIENAITCWCVMLYLEIDPSIIAARMLQLQPVEMRLEMKKAIYHCSIINDSYSNDIGSLEIALDFLQQQAGSQPTTVILSDLGDLQSDAHDYEKVAGAIAHHKVNRFIGIGNRLSAFQHLFTGENLSCIFFPSVDEFRQHFPFIQFRDEVILLKGARVFAFEDISRLFEQKVHQTVMEINLSAMVHNLKTYQQCIKPSTRIMAMVKAFSYGSGSAEVASVLQFHKVDYLAVAYADEGVELRKSGIHTPIMVLNPEPATFYALTNYNLEPELYSFEILQAFATHLLHEGILQFAVHIKLDTGMHRLGFEASEIEFLLKGLYQYPQLIIKSVLSHLVASEDPNHDVFTLQQASLFEDACYMIEQATGYPFMKHLSNSAAIFRHPHLQFDMVRLGIGLYGIHSSSSQHIQLQPVATLYTTVAQVRQVKAGESVGYNRKGIMPNDGTVATLRIGYADGYRRDLSNGVGKVFIHGRQAPVIGNVCMDMTMIDVTGIEVTEGDKVEIFGPNISIETLADWCHTIPYDIMTSISQRVKRVYYQE